MEDKARIRVALGLIGIGLILSTWAYSNLPLEGFTKGRVYLVLALYGIALLIGLWKMYKPRGVRLPEFKEDNLTIDLPDSPIGGDVTWQNWGSGSGTSPGTRAGASGMGISKFTIGQPDPEIIDDYSKAVEKYNQRRKEKKESTIK